MGRGSIRSKGGLENTLLKRKGTREVEKVDFGKTRGFGPREVDLGDELVSGLDSIENGMFYIWFI